MTGILLIDVAIALIFLYLVLSLMCSAVQEAMATLLGARSRNLWRGIENLLADSKSENPADAELLRAYVERQREEVETLTGPMVGALWLLRRRD